MESQNSKEWTNWTNYALFTSHMCGLNPVEFAWQKQNIMYGKIIVWGICDELLGETREWDPLRFYCVLVVIGTEQKQERKVDAIDKLIIVYDKNDDVDNNKDLRQLFVIMMMIKIMKKYTVFMICIKP
jgi:hypothetical protein